MASVVYGQLKRETGIFSTLEVFVDVDATDKMHSYKLHPLFPSVDIDAQKRWMYNRAGYVEPSNLPFGSSTPIPTTGQLWPRTK